jgi:hypothetical protein
MNDVLFALAIFQREFIRHDIIACNECRLALKALFLSVIVTGNGLQMTKNTRQGITEDIYGRDNSWLRTDQPSKSDWITMSTGCVIAKR